MTKPIPDGYRSLTPHLVVDDGAAALGFYERAFGAEVRSRLDGGGIVMHAEVRIGDSLLTVSDAMPDFGLVAPDKDGPVTSSLMIYCEDADALHARATAAGATSINEVSDQFHGDRAGSVRDPFGHRWAIATHTEDLTEAELKRRFDEMMAGTS